MNDLVPSEKIEKRIFLLRGQKVMLDADLAELYGVETGALKRAVKRNRERFPEDFMFPLTFQEVGILRCQNGISSWGGQRFLPYAFTEQGVAMLSSVLKSKREAGISRSAFREYFSGTGTAVVISLGRVVRLAKELDPAEIRNDFRVPQSFSYVDLRFFNRVLAAGLTSDAK